MQLPQKFITTAIVLVLLGHGFALGQEDWAPGEKLFALRVKKIFVEKCNACHGADPDDIGGNLSVLSREGLLAGGDEFANKVLVAGDSTASMLYRVVTRQEPGYEMPPKESEQLSAEERGWIRQWIDSGAQWPDEKRIAEIEKEYAEGEVVATSGGLSDDWTGRRYRSEHLWAYRPLALTEVPDDQHAVDWFIDRQQAQKQITPASDGTAIEIARRLSFGLTGLPPRPAALREFSEQYHQDPREAVNAYSQQLMDSPHYGEHFGRQWLDVSRYADTAGFANDYSRPNAWRYRDYVIRSFNSDKPYDAFVMQQIAGDEMDSSNVENLIAAGFLRMGPWEQTGMSVFEITRQQWLDDVTDSVGQVFLGHALQCAKCHDHKFDPIPTRDYYRMMAVFSTTQFVEQDASFLRSENRTGFAQSTAWTQAKIQSYQQQRNQLNARVSKLRQQETGKAKVGDNGLDPGDEASLARMSKNISRHNWEYDKTRPIAFTVYTGKTIRRGNVSNRIKMPKDPWKQGELQADAILQGGNVFSPGDPVKPGPLSAASSLGNWDLSAFPEGRGKRRLALARWIVDEKNPLTARVIVNRIWSWHFGKGIAGNPNNFGATGSLPTHPLLLDYLAKWFIDNGWSIKKLNALIVTSRAYRRSSRHPDPGVLASKDPAGKTYAVFSPRRLTAEELRDAMLATSGELQRRIGGIPCRPDINIEVAMQPRQIMGGTASVYEPDPLPSQRNRRSIYAEKIRGLRDPFFETFNQPGPDKSCELRETSTVAPQALTMMNASEMQDRALAFANRLVQEGHGPHQTIGRAFLLALGRKPNEVEAKRCIAHWNRASEREMLVPPTASTFESEVRRVVMAEKTGEPYEFIEFMPAYESYVPDLQPSAVDSKTRGLAQVCLVLFNTNEFAYLD